ncbi:response regulator transcription factor [Mongoliitalea daihaiensis]|uniref:response regulator transcription factor n=1 Tax=Mongoliitalea daihaiensis TaxID=2782006 RepID=UPI001F27CDCC|nr:helix-turn-helix transcriptional regulator [Mongoliitalea daihaiensis]UJP64414.1 helix-turn-helix transcriptional regulator [Mongoliitalea daihaiensis]
MYRFLENPNFNSRHFNSVLLPSIAATFLGANYIIFTEIGPLLKWNTSFVVLYLLLLMGFIFSWIYAGTMNKIYLEVKNQLQEVEDVEVKDLQEKLKILSRKEREVLNLILQFKSNQQICDELFISLSTLKSHINRIYKKLEVSKRQDILKLFEL